MLACAHAEEQRGLGSISDVMPMDTRNGGLAVWISQVDVDATSRMSSSRHCDPHEVLDAALSPATPG